VRWFVPGLLALLAASEAGAQDRFEIQVYDAEINPPRGASLQLHANGTILGHRAPAYPGETPPGGAVRLTLEPALGLTEFLEVGAYVQSVGASGYGFEYAGVKLRTLWVVPRRRAGPWDLGLNLEVSLVPRAAEPAACSTYLRPNLGRHGRWLGVWVNPIVGWALSGPDAWRPELTPAARVSVNTQRGVALGLEYYAGLGAFTAGFLAPGAQTHLVFAACDLAPASRWGLKAMVGAGITSATPQRLIVKAIVTRTF
jgi:hypothetical protein